MTGLCECGCGGVTQPAKRTDARTGAVAGVAEQFGVTYQSVYRIWRGQTWKQLHKEIAHG